MHRIQESLRMLYMDPSVPGSVRRRALEASVRAREDWHHTAVRAAYAGGDEAWRLTAVFCMRFVRGFNEQILQALDSENPDVRYEAVVAAGTWGLDGAWSRVAALLTAEDTGRDLLLAAIEAVAGIRPHEALEVLADFADSEDEEIAEAAHEALASAAEPSDEDDELDDELDDGDDRRR